MGCTAYENIDYEENQKEDYLTKTIFESIMERKRAKIQEEYDKEREENERLEKEYLHQQHLLDSLDTRGPRSYIDNLIIAEIPKMKFGIIADEEEIIKDLNNRDCEEFKEGEIDEEEEINMEELKKEEEKNKNEIDELKRQIEEMNKKEEEEKNIQKSRREKKKGDGDRFFNKKKDDDEEENEEEEENDKENVNEEDKKESDRKKNSEKEENEEKELTEKEISKKGKEIDSKNNEEEGSKMQESEEGKSKKESSKGEKSSKKEKDNSKKDKESSKRDKGSSKREKKSSKNEKSNKESKEKIENDEDKNNLKKEKDKTKKMLDKMKKLMELKAEKPPYAEQIKRYKYPKKNEDPENKLIFSPNPDELIICIIGEEKNGKTSFIRKYTRNTFEQAYQKTEKIDIYDEIETEIDSKKIKLKILDTPPLNIKKNIKLIQEEGINKSHIIIYILDINDEYAEFKVRLMSQSFEFNDKHIMVVIGNKSDKVSIFATKNREIIGDFCYFRKILFEVISCADTGKNEIEKFINDKIIKEYLSLNKE